MRDLGRELRNFVVREFQTNIAKLVHLHEPLFAQDRLDDSLAAFANRQRDLVIVNLLEQTKLVEHRHDLFTRGKTVEAFELGSGGGVHRAVHVHDE